VDSLGFEHEVTLTFQKSADNTWSYTYSTDDPAVTLGGTTGTIAFDSQGNLDTATSTFADLTLTMGNGADPITVAGGGNFSQMTQLASLSTGTAVADGSTGGSLNSFTVNDEGQILGVYSNGTAKVIGQIALATFQNPGGLTKMGGNMFGMSANSGDASVGAAGLDGRGGIANGYLEMSNVDLAEQFTSMIMAERGFQANSRVITTSDEVLQDLVNLKR
jgi:flagellar hook protein FlgE